MIGTQRATQSANVPARWLRAEGLAAFATAVVLYWRGGNSAATFFLLFLAPDIGMVGYLAGARVGSIAYNAVHTYVGPAVLSGAMLATGHGFGLPLIWAAHIGFDRGLGYGLKYDDSFGHTHLGRIGRSASESAKSTDAA
jgi:multisubunit Na+/H+ antiporter MnhB subunit